MTALFSIYSLIYYIYILFFDTDFEHAYKILASCQPQLREVCQYFFAGIVMPFIFRHRFCSFFVPKEHQLGFLGYTTKPLHTCHSSTLCRPSSRQIHNYFVYVIPTGEDFVFICKVTELESQLKEKQVSDENSK